MLEQQVWAANQAVCVCVCVHSGGQCGLELLVSCHPIFSPSSQEAARTGEAQAVERKNWMHG